MLNKEDIKFRKCNKMKNRIQSNINRNYLEMARKVLLIECMVINFDFTECSKVIWHQHDWDRNVRQLSDCVINAPHEY